MIESLPETEEAKAAQEEKLHRIVAAGPRGAIALAGLATAAVFAIWFEFYFLVFIPRATAP